MTTTTYEEHIVLIVQEFLFLNKIISLEKENLNVNITKIAKIFKNYIMSLKYLIKIGLLSFIFELQSKISNRFCVQNSNFT